MLTLRTILFPFGGRNANNDILIKLTVLKTIKTGIGSVVLRTKAKNSDAEIFAAIPINGVAAYEKYPAFLFVLIITPEYI
jgi:hypothetical protein